MTVNFEHVCELEKVTANKATLNYLSILARDAAERYRQLGLEPLAEEALGFADAVYASLDAKGYYVDCK